ncbi:MAG: PD40 domain-containing protein [Candidatus Hydrogenedentes bacterium]|nr:PD40 domain-containing protein [Candidatus Hydrogenedentota bacterium]
MNQYVRKFSRREMIVSALAGGLSLGVLSCTTASSRPAAMGDSANRRVRHLLFASGGRVGLIEEDGSGPRFIAPDVPGQVSWHHGPVFADGQRAILMSVEGTRIWEHNVRSHLWLYDLETSELAEIAAKNPPARYMPACALLPGEERLIVNPIIDGEQRVYTMNLDGSDAVEVTHAGEGFTYCVTLSPDATRLAFHATGPEGYRVFTTHLDGSNRKLVAGAPGHLYFGPTWSAGGEWLLYLDCHTAGGAGHDWADLCIGRPDGSEHQVVTQGQRHWFGTAYGGPDTRGSGSNIPQWCPHGLACTYTRALPDSQTAWQYAAGRPDTDHFNREYRPELARGGTEICLLDPLTGATTVLTHSGPPVWDFRTVWSPDGQRIAFCRAPVGGAAELWAMDADGRNPRFLTRGFNEKGADHPRWL